MLVNVPRISRVGCFSTPPGGLFPLSFLLLAHDGAGMCALTPVRVRASVRGCSCRRLQEMRLIMIVTRMRRMKLTAAPSRG